MALSFLAQCVMALSFLAVHHSSPTFILSLVFHGMFFIAS
jgi:hypothetical protein